MSSGLDSYPSEFVSHLQPLMFVAGLGTAAAPLGAPPPQSPALPPVPPGEPADANAPQVASPPPPPAPPAPTAPADPFLPLLGALRRTLAPKKGFSIWDNSRGATNEFHVVLVDKNVRFPPLKARPPSNNQQPMAPLHSPISPLTPTSPLYPDGIMAPIWIRKHREMVPSVFVLVLRLGEYTNDGPLDLGRKEEQERAWDAELVQEVVDRKRSTTERGIKLAVVLVCSRQLLDDTSLDARLSLIRRQSGLDSRASLFVISPVPQAEVQNFVLSFRSELFPAALDYYREHGRRVRRKRARQVPKGRLSDKGWTVRYDYKMGAFSEMRGEIEVALKHYEDAYETLLDMFASSHLAPRTKRWAEAKVLADCLTVKVCKCYLYLNEASRSVAQLNRHVASFRTLSDTWGIGEQTFEFWSWLSKQYRLFADLVAIAIRAGFRLPSLRPPPTPRPAPAGMPQPPSPGLIPPNVLMHPGYYFYQSGLCAVQRRECFKALVNQEQEEGTPVSPAVAHETKVDHAELIIDLYTKAYEYFKAHKTSRMSLFLASQIALTHYEAGKYEMALKFNDRIGRTYRREKWRDVLDSISQISYNSAMQIADYDSAIKALYGLLAAGMLAFEIGGCYKILRTKTPSSPEKAFISVDMSDTATLLTCELVFWKPTANIGQAVPFQLTLAAPPGSRTSDLTFAKLAIQFSDDRQPLVFTHTEASTSSNDKNTHTHVGDLGDGSRPTSDFSAPLLWANDSVHVFSGTMSASREVELTVSAVTLTLVEGAWTVELLLKPDIVSPSPTWRVATTSPPSRLQILHDTPWVCQVRPRELQLSVSIDHASPAYLDEEFAVNVDVVNEDEVEVEVLLDILLQPGEDDSKNQLIVDDQTSFSLIKAFSLGVLPPSGTLRKTFRLLCVGSTGERQLDLSNRRPMKALLDLSEPDGWEGASDVSLVAKLCARGPWEIEVLGLRLACEDAPAIRVKQSSLDSSKALSLRWLPRDCFNIIYQLDVQPAIDESTSSNVTGAYLEVLWRRHGETGAPARTVLPLPSMRPLPLHAVVSIRPPPFLTLHKSSTLVYRFSNPTDRLLTLSLQVDSSDGFVFAGPRKTPVMVLAPSEEREVPLAVIPLVVGTCVLPRLRVFEYERPQDDGREEESQPVMKELRVVEELDVEEVKDPAQVSLETDLRFARGGDDVNNPNEVSKPFTVLVLPR
ncbi:hypothetical protein MNV49_000175 [Pseudohyphozyma bogoriensis]|nr:hypothetical protein MNV49_000175 [Pseudohyphozyma bogoriensis]